MAQEVLQGVVDVRDGELVGLKASSLGRSGERHVACGQQLEVGDFVRLKREIVLVVDDATGVAAPEVVVKAVLIEHGQESCTVGFLPRHIALRPLISARLDGQLAQVIELYDTLGEDCYKRTKSIRNHGMAAYIHLNNVPLME